MGVRLLDGRRKLPAREPLFVVAALRRSPLRVKSAGLPLSRRLPVYPQLQTCPCAAQTVAKGQLQTFKSSRERTLGGASLTQMASEEIDRLFMMLIFNVAAKSVPLSLVKMYFRAPAMPLQAIP